MSEYRDFLSRLEAYGIDPKYALGQNFIYDRGLLDDLADACALDRAGRVLEIGSGFGTLTEALLRAIPDGRLLSYEIDRTLAKRLQDLSDSYPQLTSKLEDAEMADFAEDARLLAAQQHDAGQAAGPLHMVGNLPYYITTALMQKSLITIPEARSMTFMVQAEVWDRIKALPEDGKSYGVLAVLCHLYGKIEKVRDLPADVFYPKPRVNSVFIRLSRQESEWKNPLFEGDGMAFVAFVNMLMAARRKTISNNLNRSKVAPLRKERILAKLTELGHTSMLRAEKLAPREMAILYYA